LKNHTEPEHRMPDLEQLEAMELKRRAAEDAVKDADSYALNTRPQREKTSEAKGLDPVSNLLKTGKHASVRVDSQEGIDGVFIHSNEGGASLVLSDEMLEISLADEVAALAAEPIRIFHVQAPAPWVEQIHAGKA
jgi:hypothetical protein